uniref:Uncharacterized protein n=1 Tax=Anguilla anguilla TaxID=7936 RepID=A0A0E9UTL8_ANGAN
MECRSFSKSAFYTNSLAF